jgi:hypothetical protein
MGGPEPCMAVDQHKPEEVKHPLGRGRLPVPSEADRGRKRRGGLGLLHDIKNMFEASTLDSHGK